MNKSFFLMMGLMVAGSLGGDLVASAVPITYEVKTVKAKIYFTPTEEPNYFTEAEQDIEVIECSDNKIREKPANIIHQFAVRSDNPCYVFEQYVDSHLSKKRIIYSFDSAKELFELTDDDDLKVFLQAMITKEDRPMLVNLLRYVVGWQQEELTEEAITAEIEKFKDTLVGFLTSANPSGFTVGALVLLTEPSTILAVAAQRFIAGAQPVLAILKRRATVLTPVLDERDDLAGAVADEAVAAVECSDRIGLDAARAVASKAVSDAKTLADAQAALDGSNFKGLKEAMDDIVTADNKESLEALIGHCGDDVAKQALVWRAIDLEFAVTNFATKIIDCALAHNPERVFEKIPDGTTSMRRFARAKWQSIRNEVESRIMWHADIDDETNDQFGYCDEIIASIKKAEKLLRTVKKEKKRAAVPSMERSTSVQVTSAVVASKRTRSGPAAYDKE